MITNQRSTAALLALLTVPFGIAIYQDARADDSREGHHGRAGEMAMLDSLAYESSWDDKADDYEVYDDYNDYNDSLAALAELEAMQQELTPTKMGTDFFDAVLYDGGRAKAPTIAGPLAGIRLGAGPGDIPERYLAWSYDGITGHEDAHLSLSFEGGLSEIVIDLPDDGSALRSMTAQWGQPTSTDDGYEVTHSWLNQQEKLRAKLIRSEYASTARVALERFQTMEDLIAPDATLFGFEHESMLQLSPGELGKLVDQGHGEARVALPALLESGSALSLAVHTEDAQVQSLQLEFDLAPESGEKLLSMLKTKLGSPKRGGDEWSTVYTYSRGKRRVELTVDEKWHSLLIQRR